MVSCLLHAHHGSSKQKYPTQKECFSLGSNSYRLEYNRFRWEQNCTDIVASTESGSNPLKGSIYLINRHFIIQERFIKLIYGIIQS